MPPQRVRLRAVLQGSELELSASHVNGEQHLELSAWLAAEVQFDCDAVGATTAPMFTWNVLRTPLTPTSTSTSTSLRLDTQQLHSTDQ